jgi:hypothetical protein
MRLPPGRKLSYGSTVADDAVISTNTTNVMTQRIGTLMTLKWRTSIVVPFNKEKGVEPMRS